MRSVILAVVMLLAGCGQEQDVTNTPLPADVVQDVQEVTPGPECKSNTDCTFLGTHDPLCERNICDNGYCKKQYIDPCNAP